MNMQLKTSLKALALFGATLLAPQALAADYVIDSKGAHASINFKIKHLGYSWVVGRFDKFDGEFSYDNTKPSELSIQVNIDPASVNSNHAERDKHIRGNDFLDVTKFETARFVSTSFRPDADNSDEGVLVGDFTLRGVTKQIEIDVEKVGEGKDPWGGVRVGFEGETEITMKDFGIPMDLGPDSATVALELHVEGIRK
ncbi:YceI family protein [uncultured Ferrimonas sp.]|uniref:YceI family protein n=1 Tax=uncultured Ferrimonas sp. TaxID=432640 RepID=UPI00262CAD98|nr:YceI family protein [uncultured Ferrimonas sp.]